MTVKAVYFQVTIVLSAFLLFLVQPIMAKQILPWFGGSAGVWNTCVFFFQLLLLLGYLYAHVLVRYLTPARQAAVHVFLLAISILSLPVIAADYWRTGESDPGLRILFLLTATVGLPYLVLSSTSPLLQAWYARTMAAPYRLFALSNAASLLGLMAYPFLLEPTLTTKSQAWAWSVGFVLFALACGYVAVVSAVAARGRTGDLASIDGGKEAAPTAARKLGWIALSALGSLALISITAFIAQNIASMPLIWVAPLAIYLITFIMAFSGASFDGWRTAGPALLLALAMTALYRNADFISEFQYSLPLFMAGLFFVCLWCHGALAASKPHPRGLTGFYILIALGGAIGSLAGSILAPLLLVGEFEMPLTLAAIAGAIAVKAWDKRPLIALGTMSVALAAAIVTATQIRGEYTNARLLTRNFYGSLRIIEHGGGAEARRLMEHGRVEHGSQYLAAGKRRQPLSYYGPTSGVAMAIRRQREITGGRLSAGFVGLGAGALAAYGREGDRFRFYEINPQVVDLARTEFSYLSDSPAQTSVALGDARVVLGRERPQGYDLLIIDAFSGGAIPLHLLTREAMQIYRRHLQPGGAILFHISNRFVDLQPALARLAREEGLHARIVLDYPEAIDDEDPPLLASDWVLMAESGNWFASPELADNAEALEPVATGPAWTDDFHNLLSAVRFMEADE